MNALITTPNLVDPDELFAELISAREGLTCDECLRLDARLILLLANHIGDRDVIRQAMSIASKTS